VPKLLDQVRNLARVRHYSLRTERTYVSWIKQYILFHNKRHPAEMGKIEVEALLTHLARDRNVGAATQNQALSATCFSIVTCWLNPYPGSTMSNEPKNR
jgi:hypothetical protein